MLKNLIEKIIDVIIEKIADKITTKEKSEQVVAPPTTICINYNFNQEINISDVINKRVSY